MEANDIDNSLDYFLDFDGTRFELESGHWIKVEVKRTEPRESRPHGLKYSLTLHRSDGTRIIGFDNAHSVRSLSGKYKRAKVEDDHWHRSEFDKGSPYKFKDLPQLFEDFYSAVDIALENEK